MRITEFKNLDLSSKLDLLHKEAVFIAKRKGGDESCMLFQLEDFYVEVCYSSYRRNVHFLKLSEDPGILDIYPEPVDMAELISF